MAELARYEILSEIGANHHAKVFCGYDTQGDRDVCVLELLEKFQKNPDRWNAIWQQVLDIARVKHEYHVSVYDFDRQRRWVIVELMRGNASQLPHASLELVRTTLYRGLSVLDPLHSAGFLHGDLRPANVLFDGDGRVKLSFSPGLYLGDQIPRREFGHAFLAPEIFELDRGEVGPQVDLFALGMTAVAMLMGDQFAPRLLQGAKDEDLAWQRFHRDLEGPAPSTAALAPQTPPDVVQVIDRLIARKVKDRFASAKEALALLQRPVVDATAPVQTLKLTPSAAAAVSKPGTASNVTPSMTSGMTPAKSKVAPATKPSPGAKGGPAKSRAPSVHPAWSREWINKQLAKPLVMGTVVGGILLAMVGTMAAISINAASKKNAAVTEKPQEEAIAKTSEETATSATQPKGETPLVAKQPVEAIPAKSKWKLPDSVVALGEPQDLDQATLLPLRVGVKKVDSQLRPEDANLTFRLVPPASQVELGAAEPNQGEMLLRKTDFDEPYYLAEVETTRSQFRTSPMLKDKFPSEPVEQGDLPACGVAWEEVQQFLTWLGPEYKLPTEDQWERAARGPQGGFPWGADPPDPQRCRLPFAPSMGLVRVTELESGASPEGLKHLIGNAAEWCDDQYAPGQGEIAATTTGAGLFHSIRGGSFRSPLDLTTFRVTWRGNCPDVGGRDVGFRALIRLTPQP